jgi:hypothetical protein
MKISLATQCSHFKDIRVVEIDEAAYQRKKVARILYEEDTTLETKLEKLQAMFPPKSQVSK